MPMRARVTTPIVSLRIRRHGALELQSGRMGPRGAVRLPRQLTSFVGRERELAGVSEALDGQRLVTICGPGGAGKTRLAVAVAGHVAPAYPDGVFFVELADVTDPHLVASCLASTLSVRERPDAGVVASLAGTIGADRVLVVLDNCEHLAEACAELAAALLLACPNLRLLATSRQSLAVPGELAWRLLPLSTPPAGDVPTPRELLGYESAQLFLERARTFQPGFELTARNAPAVARICVLTGGIPLAIELAAGRLTALAPEQIAGQLGDALGVLTSASRLLPRRQRTLRATIDGSYERLAPADRVLFNRLSVFSGPAGLDAVRAVCADSVLPSVEVLDSLARLIDQSLVQAEAAPQELRYRLLELLRQYAREKLVEAGEEGALRRRHAEHFTALAEASFTENARGSQSEWGQRLTEDGPNLRAALEWSLRAAPDLALRLAAGLSWFWHTRSSLAEGRRWLERALRPADGEPAARAQALHGVGQIAYRQGDCAAAQVFLTEAIEIQRDLGDDPATARTLRSLGLALFSLGDYRLASQCLEEALAIQRLRGDRFDVARTLGSLALLSIESGRYEDARVRSEECVALARQSNDQWGLAISIGTQGELALEVGDHEAARSHLAMSIGLLAALDDAASVAYRLEGFARLAAARSEPERALTLAAAAAALWKRSGAVAAPHWRRRVDESMARCRRALSPEAAAAAAALGTPMTTEEAISFATEPAEAPRRPTRDAGAPPWASARSQSAGLSAREWDVLSLVMTGVSNRVIAGRLSISPNTVNKHVARILDKLAARSRSQAIAIALGLEFAVGVEGR
jgi:predicted ATPase/DNA-binding CsgD family transcriptional regulator